MAAAESDRQLIAVFAARHQQRPVRLTIGHAQCMVVDRVPGQELADNAAGRVGLCTQRGIEQTAQGCRVARTHAAQVVVPGDPPDRPAPLQASPEGTGQVERAPGSRPIAWRCDLEGETTRVDQLDGPVGSELPLTLNALIDGRSLVAFDQRAIDAQDAVEIGRSEDDDAPVLHRRLSTMTRNRRRPTSQPGPVPPAAGLALYSLVLVRRPLVVGPLTRFAGASAVPEARQRTKDQ